MSPRVNVQYFLPHLTHDRDTVDVEGRTVRECLDRMVELFPPMKRWLFREDGQLANFIDVFVNLESTFPDELTRPVKEGDEIFIVMMLNAG
jgi:molybdopterin converting factor small subunit